MFFRSSSTVLETTPTDADVNPALPVGYDNPGGDWFVPPELRSLYRGDPDRELDLLKGPGPLDLARQRAAVVLWPQWAEKWGPKICPPDLQPHRMAARLGQDFKGDPLPTKPTAEDAALFLHQERVRAAATELDNIRKSEAHRRQELAAITCGFCGTARPDTTRKDVHTMRGILICPDCEIVLVEEIARVKGAEDVGGRSRLSMIRDHLGQ